MFDMSKREIRTGALQYVGDAKIGATGNGGTYPQLRLPRTYAHLTRKRLISLDHARRPNCIPYFDK